MSHSVLLKPARLPLTWCESPPEPTTATLISSGKLKIALRNERPSAKQRRAVGIGNCSTPTCNGTMATGHSRSCGSMIDSGEKTPWSRPFA
jgi:hypothetical protein